MLNENKGCFMFLQKKSFDVYLGSLLELIYIGPLKFLL